MATARIYYVKAGDTRPHFIVSLKEAGNRLLSEMPTVCRLTVVHIATGDVYVDDEDMIVESVDERKFRYTWEEGQMAEIGNAQALLYLEFEDGGKQHAPTRGYVPITIESPLR